MGLAFCVMMLAFAYPQPSAALQQDDPVINLLQIDDASPVVTGDGEVELDEEPSDRRIERRLQEVLDATERFSDLGVEVRDGVVFLSGVAETDEDRALAVDLAKRTNGVAVTVNNLAVRKKEIWTLQPAIEELRKLLEVVIHASPLMLAGLLLLVIFVFAARLSSRSTNRILSRTTNSELLRSVLRKAVFLTVLVIGIYLALRVTGLTRIAIAVISGTGLLGLALGFAFRDIAENFLASLLLSIQRPFRLGDVVEVDGHTGIVRKVTSRGTLLIDFDGNHIQIANATVYKNTIKNFTSNPVARINFLIGVGYDDEITQAQEIIRQVLDRHPAVLKDPEPLVLVDELGASTVNLRVYFWINGAEHSMLKMKSSVIRLTVRGLADAGVSMPDEAREVIFPHGVPVHIMQELEGPNKQKPSVSSDQEMVDLQSRRVQQSNEVSVEAEGDLTTETHDLNRQAEHARDPEEGANVLEDSAKG